MTDAQPPDLPDLRNFIRNRRAALFGFMANGAALELDGDVLRIIPRSDIYLRYLNDNCAAIAALATEFYRRPIEVVLQGGLTNGAGALHPADEDEEAPPASNGAGYRDLSSNGSKSDGLYARLKAEIYANPERAFALILGSELTRKSNSRELFATCPFHEDRNPSFRVNLEKAKWFCDPDGRGGTAFKLTEELWGGNFNEDILPRLAKLLAPASNNKKADKKVDAPEIVRALRYPIPTLEGEIKAVHVGQEYDDGSKTMWWELPGGEKGLGGLPVTDLPLYGISRTIDSRDGEVIVVCEGEKAADSLWERRILSVGTVTGAASIPCDDSLKPLLRLKTCLWSDNDPKGHDHMERIGRRLIELGAREVLKIQWKDAPPKGDAADFEGDVNTLLDDAEAFEGNGGSDRREAEASFSDNSESDGSRQLITLDPGNLPVSVDSGEKILVANAERLKIYQRAGEVVRIVSLAPRAAAQSKKRDGVKRPDGAIILHPVTTPALLEIFERLIAWHGFNAKGKLVPKNCPARIANAYLSRVGFWELPYLAGVVEAPMLRPNGTVLDVPGYDEATEMFLNAPEGWPAIPETPTRADAEEALRVLREPFKQFPFVGEGSEEVLLAGILTALQRRLLESAPLIGVSAPSQRSGKSLIVESIGVISNGRIPAAAGVSSQSEELRKAITSILREGHLIAHLDNITYPLDSPDLARAITQGIYSDRLLGTNTTLRLPTNVLWTATGNNLTFKGDMSSRALLCRIDAKMEHPEERGFDIADLHAHLRDHCKTLVMAALTILRAFHVAGRPKQILKPWGGFDHWSREIREPLVWLGRADPCRTRERIIVSDPDRDCAMSILSAWREAFGDRAMLVAEIIRDAGPELKPLLLMVAASKNDPASIDARRMGAWCRSVEDRVFDEFQLCRFGKSHHAVNWRVSRVSGVDPKPADQNE